MEAARLGIEMNKILVLCLLLWAFLLGAVSAGSDANKHLTCDNVNCDKPEVIVSSMNKQKGYLLIPSTSARSLGRLPMSVTARRKLTPSKSVVITIQYTSLLSVGSVGPGQEGQGTNYVCYSATRTLKGCQQKLTDHQ
ncbi:hypothetical protein ACP70R_043002 [Stipagrostis hirtigluma subsp. patula]